MAHPMPQHQGHVQAQMPQNVGQQRQTPGAQQKPAQGQQTPQTQYSKYDPKLCLFVLEKSKSDKSWEDVQPLQQHIPVQDLQASLTKTRKKRVSVKTALDEISSPTIRRLVNELVEEETQKLWEINKTLQWKIASVDVDWEEIKRGRRIRRVSVMLETESSGFPDPQTVKPAAATQGVQDPNKQMKPNGMAQGQQGPMHNPGGQGPQQKQAQQHGHPMGHGQQFEQQRGPQHGAHPQMHGNPNAPPPPPPPPGHPGHGANGAPPPPPPPGGEHHGRGPQHHHNGQPHATMPGTYPRSASAHGMRNRQPHIEVVDEQFMRQKKAKKGGDHAQSSSEDGSEEWDDTEGSDDSSRPSRRGYEGERKSKKHHDKKDRSRKVSRSRKRSVSRVRARSILRDSKPRSRNSSQHRRSRKHRTYDADEYASDVKYTSGSSRSGSPHSHRSKHRRRRSSRDVSPTDFYRDKRHSDRKHRSHRNSREASEASWRGSQTSSAASTGPSSAHTTHDRVWDDHIRPSRSSRRDSRSQYHNGTSSPPRMYDDYNNSSSRRYDDRYNDYPHTPQPPPRRRESYITDHDFSTRPLPHHYPQSTTNNPNNPFNTTTYPADPLRQHSLRRANTYAADSSIPSPTSSSFTTTITDPYARLPPHHPSTRYPNDDAYKMDQLAEALLEKIQEKQRGPVPLQRRYSAQVQQGQGQMRGGGGGAYGHVDEWA